MTVTALNLDDVPAQAHAAPDLVAEIVRLREVNADLISALEEAHACATVEADGSCQGCFVSAALAKARVGA